MQDVLERLLTPLIHDRLASSPAVALIGPRQSGKTTLARTLGRTYFDLEQEPDRLRLDLEWDDVVGRDELVVLDEAQEWPEVFPRLRGAIDQDRKKRGRFLLLGSVSTALMTQVSESLAGRLALVELTPFLLDELPTKAFRERLWLTGGFPDGGVLDPRSYPSWQGDYLDLLTQRDLPNWGLPAQPQTMRRLVRMLAASHGQVWNASQLGKSLGLSYHTVNSYVDSLVGAFLIRRLPSFHANIKKRLVKSPKVYWRDSGILHSLLNTADSQGLLNQPWVGVSWEGFVIEQILGHLSALGRRHEAFYFRTSDQYEIDLVVETAGERWAIEVKLTSSPGPRDMQALDRTADLIEASRRYLISQTASPAGDSQRASGNLEWFVQALQEGDL
jgi:predicted AAA+ superfamily ATPase